MDKSKLSPLILIILSYFTFGSTAETSQNHWQYIIVGAGPSGLQMAYFLQRANRDYVVLERANVSGSFFLTYPRHDRMISINKRHTGTTNKEFNLRHDWNSLISNDESLLFGRYTKDFYPNRMKYLEYLNDFERKLQLNVVHNIDVRNVRKSNDKMNVDQFVMNDQHGNIYTCNTLLIATGMWEPNIVTAEGMEYTEGYETVSTDPDDFEGQSVLILGRGNAAFEVADRIYGSTNLVHMIGRSRVRLSWSTHYVGDLRAVNNALLDTYQLKSLDAVLEAPLSQMKITKNGNKLMLSLVNFTNMEDVYDNFAMRDPYDRVIRCLGFKFNSSIFSDEVSLTYGKGRKSKYPKIGFNYESEDLPGLYFIGTLTHSLDLRKSAGGFIHGFRYTVQALHRLLEKKNHGLSWPSHTGSTADLLSTVLKRINEASGLYQMFSMLGDVVLLKGNQYEYYEEFPVNLLYDFENLTGTTVGDQGAIVVLLDYGANFSGPAEDTFRFDRATGEPSEAHKSNFLHPVFYYYKQLPSQESMMTRMKWESLPRPDMLHHVVEDFLTKWNAPTNHILPLRRFLENVIDSDIRHYFADQCLVMAMTHQTVPLTCQEHFLRGQGIIVDESIMKN